MPGSVALIAGLVLLAAGGVLALEYLRLRRQIALTARVLHRSQSAIGETERVQHARDEVIGLADDNAIRRSYDVIAGVPFALIEASPMPKETVRLLRDAHDAAVNGVYSTLWGIDRTVGLGILNRLTGNPDKT
ncbi:MAG: hypothetical protein ACRDQW_02285 [Haloechinothrix sp.]